MTRLLLRVLGPLALVVGAGLLGFWQGSAAQAAAAADAAQTAQAAEAARVAEAAAQPAPPAPTVTMDVARLLELARSPGETAVRLTPAAGGGWTLLPGCVETVAGGWHNELEPCVGAGTARPARALPDAANRLPR